MGLRRVFSKDADLTVIPHFTPRLITSCLVSATLVSGSYLPVTGMIAVKVPVACSFRLGWSMATGHASLATSRLTAGEVLWIDSHSINTLTFPNDDGTMNVEVM